MCIQCNLIRKGKITIYELTDGPYRFSEFLNKLKKGQQGYKNTILGFLCDIAENGIPRNFEKCKKIQSFPGIWEFKLNTIDVRIIWISEATEIAQIKEVYIFNGAFKRKESLPNSLFKNAQKLRTKLIKAKFSGELELLEED